MTLRELKSKMRISTKERVTVTILGYTEKTKRYYSFYTYYNGIGWDKDLFETAQNNILDCDVACINVCVDRLMIDVIQYVPEECLDNEEELA